MLVVLFPFCFVEEANADNRYDHTPDEYLFYDTTTGQPFVYNRTLSNVSGDHLYFNCPFARNLNISGKHIEFYITNEDFMWFIGRKATENYIDFEISVYDGSYLGWVGDAGTLPVISYSSFGFRL